ncbi:hypothetical protein EYF80_011122 [Liparis tanakae]|uniref:Uncharacterized protein n=1 Tax=Liparis tanakae TaxID=230148 RepID=A0A4Z2ILW3_9TELE|nr:hypothetical protein EYF80_011122 [Liparis tanakae]
MSSVKVTKVFGFTLDINAGPLSVFAPSTKGSAHHTASGFSTSLMVWSSLVFSSTSEQLSEPALFLLAQSIISIH